MLGQIFNAKELTQKLKATVQRTGKLGFTAETLDVLNIRQGTHIRIAEDTESKRILWMGVLQEAAENAFPVNKAGDYYYVNTTKLFEKIGIDFKKKNCMYDMERAAEYDEAIGGECYKMILRTTDRKPQTDAAPEADE